MVRELTGLDRLSPVGQHTRHQVFAELPMSFGLVGLEESGKGFSFPSRLLSIVYVIELQNCRSGRGPETISGSGHSSGGDVKAQ